MNINRNAFEFDGGMVRFTMTGALIANVIRFIGWLLLIGMVVAVLVLLGFEIALWYLGAYGAL